MQLSHGAGTLRTMDWVEVGEPEVHRQRAKWVVRQSGYDPATGRRRVKQLGTFETKRAAVAHRQLIADGRAGTVNEALRDVTSASRMRLVCARTSDAG
jgi:hypothetical protein